MISIYIYTVQKTRFILSPRQMSSRIQVASMNLTIHSLLERLKAKRLFSSLPTSHRKGRKQTSLLSSAIRVRPWPCARPWTESHFSRHLRPWCLLRILQLPSHWEKKSRMENFTVTLLSNKLRFWILDAIPIIPRLHEGHRGGGNVIPIPVSH